MEDQGVQTCDFYRTDPNLPDRFNNPDCFKGYRQEKSHPLYQTSNQTYGSKKPSVHEMPTKFKGTSHQFSEAMLLKGMYRNRGFNTELDKSALSVSTETQKKRNTSRYFNECMKQSDEQETLSGFKY